MTITEDSIQSNDDATEPTAPVVEVKNPTYLDLVKATWKLGYDLSGWGDQDIFCVDGVNGYLRNFGLPTLVHVDGNMELADKYLEAWHAFETWNVTGELDEADDQENRARLSRSIRAYLRREEPKPIEMMNEWLTQLGLETFAPPPPPRHVGAYHVEHNADATVNSAMIVRAMNAMYPEANVSVSYDHRVR